MSVTSPPRPPRPSIVVDPDELEAIVEALIEEARQRARRRRRRRGAYVALALLAGAGLYFGLDRGGGGTAGAREATASDGGGAAATRSPGERWRLSRGPYGGPAYAVAVAPSVPRDVYVGTARGVFKSTDGGRSWTVAGLAQPPGPYGSSPAGIRSLVVDPRTPSTLYAGLSGPFGEETYSHPVFKSTNSGKTWRALGLRGQIVAISPTGAPTVFAAAAGADGASRLFRSIDGGETWEAADRGLPSTSRWALAFAPTEQATVYAAVGGRRVFESSDGGATWRALGLSAAYREVTAVAVDPQHPHTLYAGTDAGVITSLDGGRSWRLVNGALGAHGRDRGYGQVSALVVDPRASRTVYAATVCTGVFKSTDGGRRWSSVNSGLEPRCGWAYSLALDPRATRTLYTADFAHGLFKSVDGGGHWHAANTGLSLSRVFSLAVDPQRPGTVYASADELGLFESSDGGTDWRSLPSGPGLVDEVALDPSNPRTVLAVAKGYGVVRSADAGRTWAGARIGAGARTVHVVAMSGGTVYAGGRHLFRSTDGGRNWRELGAFRALGAIDVQALAIAPGDAAVVYAGISGFGASAAGGLYRSIDGGNSWRRLTDALDPGAIALDPESPATVYVAGGGGVLESTDGGTSWHAASTGLPRTGGVTALAIDPAHPATLYAATGAGRGVFRSMDSGRSWHSLRAGLTVRDVRALALDATGRTVYAGTAGGGVVSLRRSP